MAGMNFSIAVSLVSNGVKRGADEIRASLRSIQFQALAMAGALAGGISGLGDIIRTLVDTARATSRVQTALRNISGDTRRYAENLSYLRGLTSKYGLEINGTTEAYTKFTASASASGMELGEQQKIFESLSRSITAFGLGGNEATLTFYAISQMMAKGKVSAEELRRQLGERMPIAMEAMSRAAQRLGFSQPLDELLKKGKLISKDIMPLFAEELSKLTGEVNTDNLETSINRLKNSLSGLTEDWDVASKFKAIVDGVGKVLEHLRSSVAELAGIFGGIIGGKMLSGFRNQYARFAEVIKAEKERLASELEAKAVNRDKAQAKLGAAQAKHNDFVGSEGARIKDLREEKERLVTIEMQKQEAIQQRLDTASQQYQARRLAMEERISRLQDTSQDAYKDHLTTIAPGNRTPSYDDWKNKRVKAHAEAVAKMDKMELDHAKTVADIQQQLSVQAEKVNSTRKKGAEDVARAEKLSNERIIKGKKGLVELEEKAKQATQAHTQAVQAQGGAVQRTAGTATTAMGRVRGAMATMGAMARSVGLAIKGMLASFVPMLVIGGIISIITKLQEMKAKWDEVKKSQEEFQVGLNTATSSEITKIEQLMRILSERKGKEEEILGAKEELNRLLGTEITDTDTLLAKARERLGLEKQIAKAKYLYEKEAEAEQELRELDAERAVKKRKPITREVNEAYIKDKERGIQSFDWINALSRGGSSAGISVGTSPTISDGTRDKAKRAKGEDESTSEYDEYQAKYTKSYATLDAVRDGLKEITPEVKNKAITGNTTKAPTPPSGDDDDKKKKKKKTAEEKFHEEKKRLDIEKTHFGKSDEDFKRELRDLAQNLMVELRQRDGDKAVQSATYQEALKDYNASSPPTEDKKAIAEHNKQAEALKRQYQDRLLTEEEYTEALRNLTANTLRELSKQGKLSPEGESFKADAKAKLGSGGNLAVKAPELKSRDTSLDYKKSKSDIIKEELDTARDGIQEYQKAIEKSAVPLDDLQKKLEELKHKEVDLSKALNIATISEDVEELRKKLDKGLYSSIKELGQAVRSVSSSVKGLFSAMEDPDMSALEKALALFEYLTSVADAVEGLTTAFASYNETQQSVGEATQALQSITETKTQSSIQGDQAEMASAQAKSAVIATAQASEKVGLMTQSATKKTTALSNIGADASEGSAAAAKSVLTALPFPLNIIAVAGVVAAAQAIFKSLPKFANGGIVPGNSRSGDRVLAGVNSGELILNEAQQHNIASKLLRQNDSQVSVNVQLRERLRGRDIRRSVSRATRAERR